MEAINEFLYQKQVLYTYPDVSVFWGNMEYQDKMTLKNPVLLTEILSKVTEGYDGGTKFEMYRTIPSLAEYLMVDSRRVYTELWRKENNKWVLAYETNKISDSIELKSIDSTFLLEDFYFRVLDMIDRQEQNNS